MVSTYLDRVRDEARGLTPARVLLTLIAVVPFLLGAGVGWALRGLWVALAWLWAAAVVGFRAGRGS